MPNSGRRPLSLPATLLLLLAVTLAALLSLQSLPAVMPVATWWPAAGIAAALVGRAERRHWRWIVPAIVVLTGLANLTADRPPALAAWFGLANAAEAVVVATYLRRGTDRLPQLVSLETFVRLITATVLGAALISVLAASGVAVVDGGSFYLSVRSTFFSHAAATLVILPIAMTPPARGVGRLAWELPLQVAALAVASAFSFAPSQTLSLEFLPLPLLIWAALRFDLMIVIWELAAFAVLTTTTTAQEAGPFGFDYERGALSPFGMGAITQAYVVAAAVMVLPLAIGVEQHRRLLERTAASERLFRRNFTESVVGMLLMRGDAGHRLEITEMNEAAAKMLGGAGEPVGHTLTEVLATDEPLDEVAARLLAGQVDGWRAQTGLQGRPDARVDVALSLLSAQPEPVFAAQLLDVTLEEGARARIEVAEKLTNAALDTTAAIIIVCDLWGVVVRVNRATTTLTGFAEDELVGAEVWDLPFAPPGSTGYPTGLPDDVWSTASRETDLRTRSGEQRRVLWNSGYVLDERDRPTHVVLTCVDLTGERTAAGLTRHLLDAAITTALIGIDPQGRITVFNAGAVNLLGYDPQDTVGTPFLDLFDRDELAERCPGTTPEECFAAMTASIGPNGATPPRDWTWISSDGRRRTVSMTISTAADTLAAQLGYLCVGRDVTESRASQELLVAALDKERLAVERLRQLDVAKNEFVSTVSHELRTPVASIVGYTEMLQDGTVDTPTAGQSRLLASIERSGRRLISLCEDLLTLGGIDAGATRWERDVVDLAALVSGAEDAIRPLLSGRDLDLSFDAPAPVTVLGDRTQLDRVLINLLSNAVKFTEDGGRISCTLAEDGGDAVLTVADTGIGIPAEEQQSLFQRFFRSSTAQQRAIQGTGLGLSIVAATVAAHGGRIDVRSAHLEGTTFTVRLPLVRG